METINITENTQLNVEVIKLTDDERLNIDYIGWFAIMMYSEREQSLHHFDYVDLDVIDNIFRKDPVITLCKIVADGKEIGRFAIRNNDGSNCLTGLVVYHQYRNKGVFKQVINQLLEMYDNLYLFTSNKFIAKALFNNPKFTSNGWEFKQHCSNLEIRFETIKD